MLQPSAPPGRPAAAPTTFAAFRARTAALSGAARAEAFDRLPAADRKAAWRALGRECAERAEHERLEGRASRPRPVSGYADYLRGAAWRERAVAAKERARWRCALCDSEARLEAHHVSYARVGSERAEDLTVLCAVCHEAFHDRRALAEKRRLGRRAGSSLREAA